MKVIEEDINPVQAKEWLSRRNRFNRVIDEAHVRDLVNDIISGAFRLNPADVICFDKDGNLLNGQHRLSACVEANKPIRALVAYDCDPEAFVVMDANKRRTSTDDFRLMGLDDAPGMASVSRLLTRFSAITAERGWRSTSKVTRPETQSTVLRFGLEVKAALGFVKELELPSGAVLSRAAVCYLRFARQDEGKAKEFFRHLSDRNNLEEGSPIIALTKGFERELKGKRRVGEWETLALFHKAWSAFRDNKKLKHLTIRKEEAWWNIDIKVVPFREVA